MINLFEYAAADTLEDALKQLHLIDAIDKDGSITNIGSIMAGIIFHPNNMCYEILDRTMPPSIMAGLVILRAFTYLGDKIAEVVLCTQCLENFSIIASSTFELLSRFCRISICFWGKYTQSFHWNHHSQEPCWRLMSMAAYPKLWPLLPCCLQRLLFFQVEGEYKWPLFPLWLALLFISWINEWMLALDFKGGLVVNL